ncbi:hypothetical protein LS684_11575 [Cytobacillus spongiae]|jgi:hypothetical protein|uniref:hypothetical protein n=1 Tax=Cytobacillus spongiae TaxID=2901381 RepID=UPI001F481A2A|nr:hypothetical protein [Cytobacillus spongiae]UII54327.1 hypothetical protein LS684_11575 [Cytobacillus spongiae]
MLWTIYLALLGTASIGFLLKGKYQTFKLKLDFIISVITWIGLFGFVTEIQILTPFIWKFIFFASLTWDVVYTVFFLNEFEEEEIPLALRLSGLIILVPLYYGLFQYAFI